MPNPHVLFLCTGNSCRSQMAEGWLRHLAGDRYNVFSAGVKPAGLNPDAVRVMKEVGIDISGHRSKNVAEFLEREFSYVVTVCDSAKESCPLFPGTLRSLHWSLEDPASATGTQEARLKIFRRVRDEIKQHVLKLIQEYSSDTVKE